MNRLGLLLLGFAAVTVGCGNSTPHPELLGSVGIASVTDTLPACVDTSSGGVGANTLDEERYMVRAGEAFRVLESAGLIAASGLTEDWVGLEFVDPPEEGFDDLLAQLSPGFCIESIQFTPDPPETLDVINEVGEVSPLPETVDEVRVYFSPEAGLPAAGATEITVLLQEQGCASGREMGDRLLGPEVYESDDEVLVAAGVVIQLIGGECPSNPFTEVTITLESRVGDREIKDALTGRPIGFPDQ